VSLHGLIQHSFALQLPKERRPLAGSDADGRIRERFEFSGDGGASFAVRSAAEPEILGTPDPTRLAIATGAHSPLVARPGLTSVTPLPIDFSGADGTATDPVLPPAFAWAGRGTSEDPLQCGPTFVFAQGDGGTEEAGSNEYLVEPVGADLDSDARTISLALLGILAHKRSRLFSLPLANRIVSVLLPHLVLTPSHGPSSRRWFVQPLVSFVREGRMKSDFRDSYGLTLMLVPVTARYGERKMTHEEIDATVNAGWGLAAFPTRESPPRFMARGPLLEYLPRLCSPLDSANLLPTTGGRTEFMLRQGAEVLAFALGLRLAQGRSGRVTRETMRRIGDDVVTSLGSARVSSVLVVDNITADEIRTDTPPEKHSDLMAKIARETRPPINLDGYRRFRLDQAFVDDKTYVIGVVPTKRCLVTTCAAEAQRGWYQSGLMQAGSLAHMTVGAATAIGTLRAIDRDLEELKRADPSKIADIDDDIAIDLREVYDLDITSEEYRRLYRRLRNRLGITSDYQALQDKMATLYRSMSTQHGVKSQMQLNLLTAAIVVLSVLILIAGIVAASK